MLEFKTVIIRKDLKDFDVNKKRASVVSLNNVLNEPVSAVIINVLFSVSPRQHINVAFSTQKLRML